MARAESIALFQKMAGERLFVIVSSHILHEVDIISDSVVSDEQRLHRGQKEIQGVREELAEHPIGFPSAAISCCPARRAFRKITYLRSQSMTTRRRRPVRTRNADLLYAHQPRVLEDALTIEGVIPPS
jgi:hypothetical protein